MLYVLKTGVKNYPLNCTFYNNMILILNIFFVYRVLLIFIELLKVKLVLLLH